MSKVKYVVALLSLAMVVTAALYIYRYRHNNASAPSTATSCMSENNQKNVAALVNGSTDYTLVAGLVSSSDYQVQPDCQYASLQYYIAQKKISESQDTVKLLEKTIASGIKPRLYIIDDLTVSALKTKVDLMPKTNIENNVLPALPEAPKDEN